MAQKPTIVEQDFILLIQAKNRNLEEHLSISVAGQNISLVSIEKAEDIREQQPRGQIITFIIASDIDDPVQSAQRLHVLEKNAKIILLAKSEKDARILNEATRFSPFIGMEVFCIDESNNSYVEKIQKIFQDSVQAEKYRAIIAKTNAQITSSLSSNRQAFNQQFINKLMDIVPIGIAIVNKQGEILGWNKEAASIFGKSESQILGSPLSRLFGHPEENKIKDYLKSSFKGTSAGGTVKTLELKREVQGESKQILNLTTALFTYSGGPDQVLVLVIKDISAWKLAESKLHDLNHSLKQQAKELAASNAELEQFAFVASHDLQEPLRMVTGFLARLEKKYDSILDEKGKKYIHFATDGARRMRQIILDLLEFSRVGRIDKDREKIDLNKLVEEVLSLNTNLISAKKAKIEIDELPVITAAKSPIRQLFQNLINNAIKYQEIGSKPMVRISCSEDDIFWHFKVKDNGIGIKKEYSEKIFDIFQRLHSKDEYSGTGVGLAICKKIVAEHGGKIAVYSEEGKGSIFHFTIKKHIDSDKSAKKL